MCQWVLFCYWLNPPTLGIIPRMSIEKTPFHDAIDARLKGMEKSRYWLVQQLKGEEGLSERTLWGFLRCKSNLRSEGLAKILDFLDLKVVPKETVTKKQK